VGISIELGAEEAAELGRQIAEDLDHAEQSIRTLNRAQLAGEDAVRLETAETLIRDARQERDEGDLRAAATLAHKAKLLAEELSAE
jgi:predicted dienelactone hydrolase